MATVVEPKLIKCTCEHEFQDKLYGRNVRVHNAAGKSGNKVHGTKFRCTVCKSLKG